MRRIIFASVCAACLVGTGCYTYSRLPVTEVDAWGSPYPQGGTERTTGSPKISPCSDSLYVSLKNRPMEDLTEREYRYLMERDKACMEYQAAGGETNTVIEKGAGTGTIVLAVVGVLALIGIVAQ